MRIEVAILPQYAACLDCPIVLLIDVLRATTCLVTLIMIRASQEAT